MLVCGAGRIGEFHAQFCDVALSRAGFAARGGCRGGVLVVPSFGVAAPAVMLSASPDSSAASPIVLGLGGSQVVTVANADKAKSTSALTVALVQSAVGAGFSISQNSCSGAALGPRKSCTVTVGYRTTPGPTGIETAVLTVSSKKPDASVTASFRTANRGPVAVNDSFTTLEDQSLQISTASLLANDTDSDGNTLSVVSVQAATNGTVALVAGQVSYTPNADYNGPASFTYTITDGALTSTATVSITVQSVNDAPVANDGSAQTFEDATVTITLSATDIDSASLTAVLVAGPRTGRSVLSSPSGRPSGRSPTRQRRTTTAPIRSPTRRTTAAWTRTRRRCRSRSFR